MLYNLFCTLRTMARKGNQQRNGVNRHASNHKKKFSDSAYANTDMKGQGKASEVNVFPGEKILNCNQPSSPSSDNMGRADTPGDNNIMKQDSGTIQRKEEQGMDEVHDLGESVSSGCNSGDCSSPFVETPAVIQENRTDPGLESGQKHAANGVNHLLNRFHIRKMMENVEISGNMELGNLRASMLFILKATGDWLERHKPFVSTVTSNLYNAHVYVKLNMERAYPVVLNWLIRFGNLMILLSMFWLDLTLRGIYSFLQLGATSCFSVIWCSTMSVLVMAGTVKFLIVLVVALFVGVSTGLILGLLVVAVSGIIFLWLYGSFWTTISIITIGGLTFILSHARVALLITTVYSVYCAWTYVGWRGLLLTLNLSFLSSDILICFLKNNHNHQRRSSPEPTAGMEGQPGFYNGESFYPSSTETGPGLSSDHTSGVPSTGGTLSELSSEEEVIRLLNCADHYSALGLSRYENVDVSLLKREYRKKAMLVHPDKNMGNERAAEAFKKLQNAYEVLLDSLKRKAYDDELRREEVLNYFLRFQSSSQQNGQRDFFASGFARSEAEGEDPCGESRQIACKKCNDFHVWIQTKKSKSQARWCHDCKHFHQAKDGDGWVEQSSEPLFFGLLQKVDIPSAYVCADGKIYDATEWYICQGMRCPANTHKPSFHVNTSIASKHNTSKGPSNSRQRSGKTAASTMEENMTDEFFEWLQNAVQAGVFDKFNATTSAAESPSARCGNGPNPKSGGGSSNKRKKKGKKQW